MKVTTRLVTIGIIALVVGIGGGIGIGYLIQPQEVQGYDIRYGSQYYPGEFLLEGHPEFWSKYNVTVEQRLFLSGGDNNIALIAGEVDINCGSDSKTVSLFSAKPDETLLIGTIQRGDRYSTVVRNDSSYTSWYDLVGQPVGIKYGTGAEQVVLRYFDTVSDLGWDNFTWIPMEVTNMISALETEQIEAFTAWEHTPSVAVDQGIGKIMMSYGYLALTPASLHTTKAFAYAHPTEVIGFLAGHLDKYQMITEDIDTAAQIAHEAALARNTNISANAFKLIFQKIDFQIDFNETIIEAIEDTAQFMFDNEQIPSIPDIVWDDRFVKAAMELQENYGTPATGTSLENYQQALLDITEKYFGSNQCTDFIAAGLFIGTFGIVMVVFRTIHIKKRKA